MNGAPSSPGRTRRRGGLRALPVLLALLAGLLLGRWACAPAPPHLPDRTPGQMETHPPGVAADTRTAPGPTVWTCSMHPQIRLPDPGPCPLCGMDLIPLRDDDAGSQAGPATLRLSPSAAALAEIVTAPVERRSVAHEVRMVGKVDFDETAMAEISAWVAGRLDRLYVDYTGVTVRKGDHMVEIFSPQLIATQKELLSAIEAERRLEDSPVAVVQERQAASVASARERLRLWGLTSEQIDAIVARGETAEHVELRAPIGGVVVAKNALEGAYVETGTSIYTIADLSRVWVQLDAYESDLHWLHYGQAVRFRTEAAPGRVFTGRIAFIDPVLDDTTRTVDVRVNVDNADLVLKPQMFVHAVVAAEVSAAGRPIDTELAGKWMCPMHPEVLAEGQEPCPRCGMDLVPVEELGFTPVQRQELPLVVPRSAALVTGKRALVYVRLPGEQPVFEAREVLLGPRAGEFYVVAEGLREGEQVVVNGAFKLDSELQIRGGRSMMGAGGVAGHAAHAPPAPGGAGGPGPHAGAAPESAGASAAADPVAAGARGGSLLPVTTPVRDALGQLVAGVQQAGAALAADALPAPDVAAALVAAQQALAAAQVTGEVAALLAAHEAALSDALARLAGAHELPAARAAFAALNDTLRPLLERLGVPPGQGPVQLVHCPMAFDDTGAVWLQGRGPIRNPYFGAAMLRCGEVLADLPESR